MSEHTISRPITAVDPEPALKKPRRIQSRSGWVAVDLQELWDHRELLIFRALRDIKVRYKQTALGAAWAVIQPVTTMIVFSIFFGRLAGIENRTDVPYPLAVFCALLPWQLFAFCLTQSSNSLVDNGHILTKVYFPRLIMPMSTLLCGLVDFCIAFGVFIGMMIWYQYTPSLGVLLLPVFVVLALMTALSVGLWLSALNVKYRDVRYVIPFVVQIWMFATPVAYPLSMVPERWQWLYGLNPMVGVVSGFRWALLGGEAPGWSLTISVLVTIVVLIGGLFYFRRMERHFADVI